ncbi:putative esterase [Sphingopyxis sp. LC81]|uniref:alpha/beta hydrolase n=1 Tax=Sphingopyxis sp. LC81 TaxID=1502850 RepID=UPI00050E281B|nr:alpha/beta hydrolase [Sphingopyxis sp. LC81]KGB57245.1 putative esterase [Sphingopyxis sp. LC81]
MNPLKAAFFAAACAMLLPVSAAAEAEPRREYDVQLSRNVVYGRAPIDVSTDRPRQRDLLLDVYRPVADGKPLANRPAVIMAFGGAFHRGDKGEERFTEDGAQDSSMADYCRRFAREGYVCFSIDYRLTPEDPGLAKPVDEKKLVPKSVNLSPAATARIELVRQRMGLPPLDASTRDQYWRGILAAAEDMAMATGFVRGHAGKFGVNPDRIALGGFSAGAITALNTAYGIGTPVKAVFTLSGGLSGYNLFETVQPGMPPALFLVAQNDLEGIQSGTRFAVTALASKGIATEQAWVPGFGHFYPMGAVSLGSDVSRTPVETRILAFLEAKLGHKPRE